MREPTRIVRHEARTQRLYALPDGSYVSAVCGPYTYGGTEGLWEIAWLTAGPPDARVRQPPFAEFEGDQVIGYLTLPEVDAWVERFEALTARKN